MINSQRLTDLHLLVPTPKNNRKSIALISLHKAATSYFSNTVLKHVSGMVSIDYQDYHYKNGDNFAPIINPSGYIYGVLKIYDDDHPAKILTDAVIHNVQQNELDTAILIRDPRDIIVSMYYSFGFSHGLSPHEATRQFQIKRREEIQSMNIDEYAIFVLPQLKKKLSYLSGLGRKKNCTTILKYDEMIISFKSFYKKLRQAIPVNSSFESIMSADTRPQLVENIGSHRRSGAVGGYVEKLNTATVDRINFELRTELNYFDYF